MINANILPMTTPTIRDRNSGIDAVRRRALERLYERRAAVDELIESLEIYQRCHANQRAVCISFNEMPKCS